MIVKGKVVNTADGSSSGLIKPVMPVPPSKEALDAAILKRNDLNAQNTELNRQYQYHISRGDTTNADIVAKQQVPVANQLSYYRDQLVPQLQAEYDKAYADYQAKITQYNKDFAAWAEAQAKINNTDPEVLRAQIDAEKAKTENALKIAESSASTSGKKWIIVAIVITVLIIVGVAAWYFIKKKGGK